MVCAFRSLLGKEYARYALPDDYVPLPTEHCLSLATPVHNQPGMVHGHECVECGFHDSAVALLTPFERQSLPVKVPINRRSHEDQSEHQDSDQRDAGDTQVGDADRVIESGERQGSRGEMYRRHTDVVHYGDGRSEDEGIYYLVTQVFDTAQSKN